MATVSNGWISFKNNYSTRLVDIEYVYAADNQTRICLKNGGSFFVNEIYADVMRVIDRASAS